MQHFFTAPEYVRDGRVALTGPEAHHAGRVLRVKPGETISVADGSGRILDAVVTRVGEVVEARVILEHERRQPQPELVLYQGVAKGERMDLVVQKSVELGVRSIIPFMAERTVARWDEAKREKARIRWAEIARAAAKQCRSPWLTDIGDVADDIEIVIADSGHVLILHEHAVRPFRDALPSEPPSRLAIVVGPEGGLTEDEVAAAARGGGEVVTLGERILRTETAGPVALALISYSYGNLG